MLFIGDISSEEFSIADLDLSSLQDGYIEIELDVTDPNGNLGEEPYVAYYSIEGNTISYVGTTLGVDALETSKRIILYPNPTSSLLALNSDKEYDIEVYDMAGNKVMALTGNTIDMSHLSSATYIVKALDKVENEEVSYKVVKN